MEHVQRKTLMLLCWPISALSAPLDAHSQSASDVCPRSICYFSFFILINTWFLPPCLLKSCPWCHPILLQQAAGCCCEVSLARLLEISPWTFQEFCFSPLKASLPLQTIWAPILSPPALIQHFKPCCFFYRKHVNLLKLCPVTWCTALK